MAATTQVRLLVWSDIAAGREICIISVREEKTSAQHYQVRGQLSGLSFCFAGCFAYEPARSLCLENRAREVVTGMERETLYLRRGILVSRDVGKAVSFAPSTKRLGALLQSCARSWRYI